ncbi:MAG: hypothetical protein V7642_2521 [Burkholderiales bacterium]
MDEHRPHCSFLRKACKGEGAAYYLGDPPGLSRSFMLPQAGYCASSPGKLIPVIPAQAGIHAEFAISTGLWIPACAGMTGVDWRYSLSQAPARGNRV